MGVTGSFCQLCRLPLQHDHYVPELGGGMLKIYRGGEPDGGHRWEAGERVVRLGPEHAWLADAVAVPPEGAVLRGAVQDGVLVDRDSGQTAFIWEGDDEAYAYHHYCWELLGSPATMMVAPGGRGTHGWAVVEAYGGQLFELAAYVDHGHAWALVDPRREPRSRERIDAIAAQARLPLPAHWPDRVRDVIALDRGWRGATRYDADHQPTFVLRDRIDARPELVDLADFGTLVWAMKEYGKDMPTAEQFAELERFELAVKAAVERDAAAILIMTTIGNGQQQLLIQARDEKATCAAIDAIASPLPLEYDNEADPTWHLYFEQMRIR